MAAGSEQGGCLNCYAAAFASRFGKVPGHHFEGYARKTENGPRWTGRVELIPGKLDEPLRWKKPQRIFVNSMSDLFHPALPDSAIDRVFAAMATSPRHTFLVLTKRPDRMLLWSRRPVREYVGGWGKGNLRQFVPGITWGGEWPLPNVWLGVSVEDQATADARIPLLLQTPALKRFISYEPALGPLDFGSEALCHAHDEGCVRLRDTRCNNRLGCLDWVIVGGESGPGARPFEVEWARSILRQCRPTNIPVFVKQMGRWVLGDDTGFRVNHWLLPGGIGFVPPLLPSRDHGRPAEAIGFSLLDHKGGDMDEWPADLHVREFPA